MQEPIVLPIQDADVGNTRRPYAKPTIVRRDPLDVVTAMPVVVSPVADAVVSDVRLKEDIERVGTTAHGLSLYRFRYRGRPGRYEGVMAQEAQRVMPEAVLRGADGFLKVDYRKLGAPFRRVQ